MNYKKLSKLSDSLEQKFKLFAGPHDGSSKDLDYVLTNSSDLSNGKCARLASDFRKSIGDDGDISTYRDDDGNYHIVIPF